MGNLKKNTYLHIQTVQKCLRKRENVQSNKFEGQIASFGEQFP